MAKSKSSASSATRKKHLKKANNDADDAATQPQQQQQQPAQRGQKKVQKKSRFDPKIKVYTPPPATPKGIPDPVDLYLQGGKSVDAELVVVLRKLAKRDESTISKGVEGLEAWIREYLAREKSSSSSKDVDERAKLDQELGSGEQEEAEEEDWIEERRKEEIIESMTVWAHHFPRLALHSSRRLRLQTHSLHSLLTSAPSARQASDLIARTRQTLLSSLWLDQQEYVGSWCVSSWDSDRSVRNIAKRSWDAVVDIGSDTTGSDQAEDPANSTATTESINLSEHAESILSFARSLLLLPTFVPSLDPLVDSAEEDPALLRTQSLLALSYLVKVLPGSITAHLSKDALRLFRSEQVWMFVDAGGPAILRRAAYELLGSIVERTEVELLSAVDESTDASNANEKDDEDEGRDDDEDEDEDDAGEESGVQVIARYVLKNCWVEEEGWAGVIAFLRRYPQAWSLANRSLSSPSSPSQPPSSKFGEASFAPSPSLSLFLMHLSTSCSGHPSMYPTVLLLLSTLPPTILPRSPEGLTTTFDAFWSPWIEKERSLLVGGQKAIEQLVTAFSECLLFEINSLMKSNEASKETLSHQLVQDEVVKMWNAYLSVDETDTGVKRVKGMSSENVAALLKSFLNKLGARYPDLLDSAWSKILEISSSIPSTLKPIASPLLSSALLNFMIEPRFASPSAPTALLPKLAQRLAIDVVLRSCADFEGTGLARFEDDPELGISLLHCISALRGAVESEASVLEAIDSLISTHLLSSAISADETPISLLSFQLLSQHLSSPATPRSSRDAIWTSITTNASADVESLSNGRYTVPPRVLLRFVDAMEEGLFPRDLAPAGYDAIVSSIASRVIHAGQGCDEVEVRVIEKLISVPAPFISEETQFRILAQITSRLDDITISSLSTVDLRTSLVYLAVPTRIFASYVRHRYSPNEREARERLIDAANENEVVVEAYLVVCAKAIFQIAHLLPACVERLGYSLDDRTIEEARTAWSTLVGNSSDPIELIRPVLTRLQELLLDIDTICSPIEIINSFSTLLLTSPESIAPSPSLTDILPSDSDLQLIYEEMRLSSPSPALSILDPLIASSLDEDDDPVPISSEMSPPLDQAGLSIYARAVLAILEIAARNHSWVRKNIWIMSHLLIASEITHDTIALPSSSSSSSSSLSSSSAVSATRTMFGPNIDIELLTRIGLACEGLGNYILSTTSSSLDKGWHANTIARLRSSSKSPVGTTGSRMQLVDVLAALYSSSSSSVALANRYEQRAFVKILESCLKYGEEDNCVADAERWLALAMNLEEGTIRGRMIILAIKATLHETPRFERHRNSIASNLAGVSPTLASTTGITLLDSLLATTPPLESSIIFLPQQRTIFLLQTLTSWIASDVDVQRRPEILLKSAELLSHLVPIVQELSGAHWDLVFDVVESNLESASWDDNSTLPALFYSSRLLEQMKDLAATNRELRSISKARIDRSLELVRDLFVSRPASRERNVPRKMILDLMARLVQDLPSKLLTMGASFDQLILLLSDPALSVQQSAYQLLSGIAEQHVLNLVVEVELDPDSIRVVELPSALISVLSATLSSDALYDPEEFSTASTFLFAWLTVLQFFNSASPRIRSAYLDHLNRLELISKAFLPSIFVLLSVSDHTRSFDASPYAVDEFYVELFDGTSLGTLPVFATYIYYRALQSFPSLIRFWWDRCQNRQLSHAVITFTTRHFSPVLIAGELAHLRDPEDPAGRELRDNDDFTVKVAAGGNEVKAMYVVDDETMEIVVRLPNEFPLASIEVKEVRKIGVTDGQWRAWMFAVQSQNGRIHDALMLFKRNIILHFEGVEACAICYGVISVVDRTLPTKPCKTCKNLYHPSCLYKWFQSSSGSSCPICRSLF